MRNILEVGLNVMECEKGRRESKIKDSKLKVNINKYKLNFGQIECGGFDENFRNKATKILNRSDQRERKVAPL